MQRLNGPDQQALVRAIGLYADALAASQADVGEAQVVAERIPEIHPGGAIQEGYSPGCIGDIVGLHARFYARLAGFGAYFERKVATELAEFVHTLPSPDRRLWLYLKEGHALASIAIDVDPSSRVAHLRWFIVDASLRGTGIGRRLLELAVDFIARECRGAYLWIFKGLDAARHLYEAYGFVLAEEASGAQWGVAVTEQRFERAP